MRIGLIAGEASGDILGAGLIQAIRKRHPEAKFIGIAGPRMVAAGCQALYAADKLSMMGYIEPLKHLPELLSIRRHMLREFSSNPPDVFIGIDAPDFNLYLERKLKAQGIKTVHYVSPSVWAWRQERVKKFPSTMDLMLTLFPFEAEFYRQHHMPVTFVGHPLADMIPMQSDQAAARQALGLSDKAPVLALLPGSRKAEVRHLAADFIRTAKRCRETMPGLQLAVPLANSATRNIFEQQLQAIAPHLTIHLYDGQSHEVMTAADTILLASGTAALEAMLLKRPMVVAYRMGRLAYWLAKRKIKVPFYSLPNLLAGEGLVPEISQHQVNAATLAPLLLTTLQDPDQAAALRQRFTEIHDTLRCDANERAADAVLELIGG